MSLTLLGLLIFFLGSTIWVGISLILVGIICFIIFTDNQPLKIMSNIFWDQANDPILIALPLFILMGEILYRSKISENLFRGLAPWMTFLPGRLIHVNIISSGLFAAVSGSSAATTVTVGKIALPELLRRNYNRSISIGTLAGAGTLGFLIPPSLMMIVYGIMANVSIGKLFIAGIIPGIIIAVGLMGFTIIRCLINPNLTPNDDSFTWKERIRALPLILPVIFLIVIVLGSIYAGWATPTEAAAVGVLGSFFLALLTRSLTIKSFMASILGTVKTNAMIMMIVIGASYLSVVVGYLGIPTKLTEFVNTLGLSSYGLIAVMAAVYILLGMILDGFSMIVMTLPLALPLITAAGFDPLWFGVFLVIVIEIAQITPPVGFNLFVLNGLVKDDIFKIAYYALPSFLVILFVAAIITLFPEIVLWLPNKVMAS